MNQSVFRGDEVKGQRVVPEKGENRIKCKNKPVPDSSETKSQIKSKSKPKQKPK
jgi:hypothetical protein